MMAGVIVVASAWIVARMSDDVAVRSREFLRQLLLMNVVLTVITLVYAKRGIDDLHFTYVERFYVVVPMLTVYVCAAAIWTARRTTAADTLAVRAPIALGLALMVFVGTRNDLVDPYPGANWIPTLQDD